MRVKMDVSPDSDIKVEKDEAGNVLSVEFEPFFNQKKGQAVLAYGAVINDKGVTLDRFSLAVSGATGKISKRGRAETVKAAADDITDASQVVTEQKPAATPPPATPPKGDDDE